MFDKLFDFFSFFPVVLLQTILKCLKLWPYQKNEHRKQKKNARKANWKKKADKAAQKSLSLAKSLLKGKTTSFLYSVYIDE